MLLAGDSTSTIRIRWLDDPGSPPLAPNPATVRLELIGPTGRAALVPHPDSANLFLGSLPVLPGKTYRLSGTVEDQWIDATTRVPGGFVTVPAGDTVEARRVSAERGEIDFAWTSDGATVVLADSARFPPGHPATRDPRGVLFLTARPPGAIGPSIQLWALNSDLERYLIAASAPASNVRGGSGVFGAAVRRSWVVRWP